MQVDYYTKAVLTVIAAALTISALQNMVNVSNAQQSSIQKVTICDENGEQCAGIASGRSGKAILVRPP